MSFNQASFGTSLGLSNSTGSDNYFNDTTTSQLDTISTTSGFLFNFTYFTDSSKGTTPPPPNGTNSYLYLLDISKNIKKFCLPTLFVVGTIGNLLTVLILSLKKNRSTSTAMFLLFLAVSDIMILFTSYLSEWMVIMWNFNFREVNSALCKLHVFLTYFSLQFSSWILVLVTCERVVSVINPTQVRIICNRRRGMCGLGIIAIFITLLNGHWLVGLVHEYNTYTMTYCAGSSQGYITFLNEAWPIVDFCVTFAFPFLIIMTGNAIIILKLTRATRARSHMVASDKKKNTSSLTVTLVVLNIVFIISMAPASIFLLTYYLTIESQNQEEITQGLFIFDMVNLLAGLNATLNFILYFLSGSKFRADVKAMFCCKQGHLHGVFEATSDAKRSTTKH